MTDSEGTYLAWVDLNQYCRDAQALEERLLRHGVVVNQGIQFGKEGSGHVRINLAMPRALLKELLVRPA